MAMASALGVAASEAWGSSKAAPVAAAEASKARRSRCWFSMAICPLEVEGLKAAPHDLSSGLELGDLPETKHKH